MIATLVSRLQCYRFDWKLSALTALLLPLLISLGFWQLRRADDKLALQAQYEQRQQQLPTAFSQIDWNEDLQYRQVSLVGQVDAAHVFLLDNRTYQGHAGYEVIQPVLTSEGVVVLVNRGWIAAGATRADLPVISPLPAQAVINGSIYQNISSSLVLGGSLEADGWPKVVQTLEPKRLAALAGYSEASKVFPYSVRLAESSPGVLTRFWPVISTTPEKHTGYAVQWFLMAAASLLLYCYYSTREEALDQHVGDRQNGKRNKSP